MRSTTILVCALLIIAACKSTTQEEITDIENTTETFTSVIEPISGLEIVPTIYKVVAETGAEINLPNGGKINIPAGAFEDKNGNEIKGAVDIEWQEFHSLTDLMLSGIPMKYDSAGVQNNFVSGGMFTINANKDGEEMFIRKGKDVNVDIASIDDTPCYNFYELDEKTGDWAYELTAVGTPIQKEEAPKKEVEKFENTLIDCEVDFSQFPELQDKNIVAWSAKDKLTDTEQRIIKSQISQLSLKKDDEGYFLNFKREKDDTKIKVKPFLLKDAQAKSSVLKDELKVDYAQLLSNFQSTSNSSMLRSISIDNFGTYNWDCIHSMTDVQPLAASFEFEGNPEDKEGMSVFYVCPEDNLIIRCYGSSGKGFFYSPNKTNALVAISSSNEVFILDDKTGFRELKKDRDKKSHIFVLESTGLTAESGLELGEIVKNIL